MSLSHTLKRILDVTVAFLLLILISPLLVLVGLLILVFEGWPIFYISKRFVSRNRSISIYKFRTMVKDAKSPKYRLNERFMRDGYLDIPLDCEVYTPIGRLLEKTQLVEILQLFNIIFHGVSLIGNRPLPKENLELLKKFEGWEERFDSPAGITGITQVVGKMQQQPEERIELERLYSSLYRNGNVLKCDFLIAWHTVRMVLFRKPLSIKAARQLMRHSIKQTDFS
ncbi:MAG: sugar transferase [Sulfuricella sp.]|nr:sugar transferase [Sulfuricella sp.]